MGDRERRGAREILLTEIDGEGTWKCYAVELTAQVADAVTIPVIAHCGAGSVEHIGDVVKQGHASAVALDRMMVYQGRDEGVLVNFPDNEQLAQALGCRTPLQRLGELRESRQLLDGPPIEDRGCLSADIVVSHRDSAPFTYD